MFSSVHWKTAQQRFRVIRVTNARTLSNRLFIIDWALTLESIRYERNHLQQYSPNILRCVRIRLPDFYWSGLKIDGSKELVCIDVCTRTQGPNSIVYSIPPLKSKSIYKNTNKFKTHHQLYPFYSEMKLSGHFELQSLLLTIAGLVTWIIEFQQIFHAIYRYIAP